MNKYIEKSFTFDEYLRAIDSSLAGAQVPTEEDTRLKFTVLNRTRMDRLAKTITLEPETEFTFASNEREMIWLVITEGWCGDAAQNVPVIEAMASRSGKISTRYLFRDENLELMDQFLTDGARSIPKLIAIDAISLDVLGTWGARPEAAQQLYTASKEAGDDKAAIMEKLQRWYNADKGRSIQAEFIDLLQQWNEVKTAVAVK